MAAENEDKVEPEEPETRVGAVPAASDDDLNEDATKKCGDENGETAAAEGSSDDRQNGEEELNGEYSGDDGDEEW